LRLYNRALSAAEIQQIYQAGSASLVSIAVTSQSLDRQGCHAAVHRHRTYNDSSTQNLTSSVTWSSTNTAAATITSGGLATGVGTGTTTIGAASGSINGTTNLTVTAVTAVWCRSRSRRPIPRLQWCNPTVHRHRNYSDSSTQNLTSSVTWTSSSTSLATITSGGLATGVGTGTTTIGAASGSINGTTNLTVTTVLAQGFAYRRAVTLTNSGSTLTNYQVKIALTSSN